MISVASLVNYYRRKMNLPIGPRAIVLDVGSGGKPHPRANVLCERYLNSTRDRCGLGFDRQGKHVVVGDIHALPFKDGVFDYVICCHVLEHVPDPARAVRELQRVGRAGYIETPSELLEVVTDNPAHESVVRVEGDKLVFQKKVPYPHHRAIKPHMQALARRREWQRLLSYDEFFVRHLWRGRIDFQIVGGERAYEGSFHIGDVVAGRDPRTEPLLQRILRRHVLRAVAAVVYPNRAHYVLQALLCCPACHSDLVFRADALTCRRCAVTYGYAQPGVPRLLLASAATKNGQYAASNRAS